MDEQYTVEVDLGREIEEMPIPEKANNSPKKKGNKRKFYPTLYIDAIEGMPALPKEGCMMVKFRRKSMRLEENSDGKETAGMTLEIRKMCLPENMDEEPSDTLADAFKEPRSKKTDDYSEDGEDE